ncbi:hypothetical protein TorRG33x02_195030 [Trema orientale]|uniref:Uncharacterized protein n=1 Tax=Trema orientale TaxID=63057 RepID=A0A2P5EGK4_TREOI|nr:hypothetical protein TorRG33x02_195030 [Trema orientale]
MSCLKKVSREFLPPKRECTSEILEEQGKIDHVGDLKFSNTHQKAKMTSVIKHNLLSFNSNQIVEHSRIIVEIKTRLATIDVLEELEAEKDTKQELVTKDIEECHKKERNASEVQFYNVTCEEAKVQVVFDKEQIDGEDDGSDHESFEIEPDIKDHELNIDDWIV